MKYVEVSKKIKLGVDVSEEGLRQSLMTRMRRAFSVDELREQPHGLHVRATSGGPGRMMRCARVDLNIAVSRTDDTARITMHGYAQVAKSMLVVYSFLFLLVVMAGLLPGSVATSGGDSGPLAAMVFLIFGIFIFYDINKQLQEALEYLREILDSLEAEFG